MKSIILSIFILIFSVPSWAYSCKETDKLEDLRSTLAPLRDQDSIGWCYSFTASDLLTDYLRRNRDQIPTNFSKDLDFTKTENTVSPLSGAFAMESAKSGSAVSFTTHADESLKNYDEVLEINNKLAKNAEQLTKLCGSEGCFWGCIKNPETDPCKEWIKTHDIEKIKKIGDELDLLNDRKNMYYWAYQKGIIQGGLTENIAEYFLNNGFSLEKYTSSEDTKNGDLLAKLNEMMLTAYMEAKTKDEALCNGFNVLKQICSSCENLFTQIKPALESGFDWKNSVFHEFMNLDVIKNKVKNPTDAKVINIPKGSNEDIRERISQYLKKGQIVGIGYDVKDVVSLNSGGHASSIVGRACINGQENFILRNSWGDNACDDSKKSITLSKIESLASRIKYGDTKITDADKNNYNQTSGYRDCFAQCQKIKEPEKKYDNIMGFGEPTNIAEITRKKLEKTECENTCYQKSKVKLSGAIETFECDKGYYFIRSEKLLNAIKDIQVIE
jgi:hypothetical protein